MNIYLLFNSDVVNFVLKADGDEEVGMGNEMQKALIFYLYIYIYIFFFLGGGAGCFNYWWVRCGGVG